MGKRKRGRPPRLMQGQIPDSPVYTARALKFSQPRLGNEQSYPKDYAITGPKQPIRHAERCRTIEQSL